jgi:hypothetical protein
VLRVEPRAKPSPPRWWGWGLLFAAACVTYIWVWSGLFCMFCFEREGWRWGLVSLVCSALLLYTSGLLVFHALALLLDR